MSERDETAEQDDRTHARRLVDATPPMTEREFEMHQRNAFLRDMLDETTGDAISAERKLWQSYNVENIENETQKALASLPRKQQLVFREMLKLRSEGNHSLKILRLPEFGWSDRTSVSTMRTCLLRIRQRLNKVAPGRWWFEVSESYESFKWIRRADRTKII